MKIKVTAVALALVALASLGVVLARNKSKPSSEEIVQETKAQESPARKPSVEEALRDASLRDLIRNARVATRKGDQVTRSAMVTGLKKEPSRARELIQLEISKAKDPTDREVLAKIGSELP